MAPQFDSPPRSPDRFSKPRPRHPKSPAQSAQIRVQNRRRAYLERNAEYFKSTEHELADPLLYDSLVRRFQSPAEREAEERAKGYSRVLEGSLLRGEARLEAMAQTYVPGDSSGSSNPAGPPGDAARSQLSIAFSVEADLAPKPETKEEARARWEEFLRDRFVHGGDEEFEYARVDENDEFDVLERKDQEDAWFDDEDPGWASEEGGEREEDEVGVGGGRERKIEGQTGIQDF